MLLTTGGETASKSYRVGLSQGIDLDLKKKFHCSFEVKFLSIFFCRPSHSIILEESARVLSNVFREKSVLFSCFNLIIWVS